MIKTLTLYDLVMTLDSEMR